MIQILVVAAVVIAAFLAFAATRPGAFRVQRVASIKAPAEQIFPLIDDFHRWGAWSPWEKWEGNAKVGKGRMEITDRSAPSHLTVKLDFLRPFEGHNICEFTLEPTGDATRVTLSPPVPRGSISSGIAGDPGPVQRWTGPVDGGGRFLAVRRRDRVATASRPQIEGPGPLPPSLPGHRCPSDVPRGPSPIA